MLSDTLQTIIILYVFSFGAFVLMIARLIMRKVRGQSWNISDYVTMVCILCLMARVSMIHVVLVWGTNNVPRFYRAHHTFTPTEIYQRETASKLLITSRTFYNTYLWLQKGVVLLLSKRILSGLPWMDTTMKLYWTTLGATYIVIQVVTFTDCRPLRLYYQVVPNPGTCSQALGQLIIVGALNIFTDILLIVLPMPALFEIRRSFPAKMRLFGLFSLGIFLVIITVIRLPLNFDNGTMQVNRTTWASVEAFTAAFVANVPTLYTLRKRAQVPTPPVGPDGRSIAPGLVTAVGRRRNSDETDMSVEPLGKEDVGPVTRHIENFEARRKSVWKGSRLLVKDNNAV